MAVKLYTIEELKSVHGLYADKALAKMNGDMEIYSTLLDKFLNQTPRTIPKLRLLLKEQKMPEYCEELRALRIDLADIFALALLERANFLYETAEKGEIDRCVQQLDPFLQALQSFAYEVKQCRTQEGLTNEEEAGNKAAELDIGASVVNNKYSTVNKSKFLDLYKRIDNGLIDKAINLTNVLKAMNYDSEISGCLYSISENLNVHKTNAALAACGNLLTLLGCQLPESAKRSDKFNVILVDASPLVTQIGRIFGDNVRLNAASTTSAALTHTKPDFLLINSVVNGSDGFLIAKQLRASLPETPLGFLFSKATPQDILKAREVGATEFFLLPLDEKLFLEKMSKYMK